MNIYSFIQTMRSWLQFGMGGLAIGYNVPSLEPSPALLLASKSASSTNQPSANQLYLIERFRKLAPPNKPYEAQNPVDEQITISISLASWPDIYTVVLGVTEFQRAADIGNVNHDIERTFHFTPYAKAHVQTQVWQSQTGKNGRVLIEDNISTLAHVSDEEFAEIEDALLWQPLAAI